MIISAIPDTVSRQTLLVHLKETASIMLLDTTEEINTTQGTLHTRARRAAAAAAVQIFFYARPTVSLVKTHSTKIANLMNLLQNIMQGHFIFTARQYISGLLPLVEIVSSCVTEEL